MSTSKGCGHAKGKVNNIAPRVSLTYGNVGSPLSDSPSLVHSCLVTGSYSPLTTHQMSMPQLQYLYAPPPYG